jgi:hypothetical protein
MIKCTNLFSLAFNNLLLNSHLDAPNATVVVDRPPDIQQDQVLEPNPQPALMVAHIPFSNSQPFHPFDEQLFSQQVCDMLDLPHSFVRVAYSTEDFPHDRAHATFYLSTPTGRTELVSDQLIEMVQQQDARVQNTYLSIPGSSLVYADPLGPVVAPLPTEEQQQEPPRPEIFDMPVAIPLHQDDKQPVIEPVHAPTLAPKDAMMTTNTHNNNMHNTNTHHHSHKAQRPAGAESASPTPHHSSSSSSWSSKSGMIALIVIGSIAAAVAVLLVLIAVVVTVARRVQSNRVEYEMDAPLPNDRDEEGGLGYIMHQPAQPQIFWTGSQYVSILAQ